MKILKSIASLFVFLSLFVGVAQVEAATNVSGTISVDTTWTVVGSPYVVTGTVTISEGVTLTIESGAVVKFNLARRLIVEGTLIADGTPTAPIYFTSLKDDSVGGDTNGDGATTLPVRGGWYNLWFKPASANNLLDNVVIRYGGAHHNIACPSPPDCHTLLSIETSDLTLSNSTVEEGRWEGIYVANASPSITGSVVRNNGTYGIHLTSSDATITNSTISGNGNYGILNSTSSIVINAENNYWGDPSGPYDPLDDTVTGGLYNPGGNGDSVSNYIDYDPWLSSDPNVDITLMDQDGDGYTPAQGDCKDDDPSIHPDAVEGLTMV